MVAKLPKQATMNADGSGLTNLTNNPAEHDAPVWSPDGSQIAFTFSREGGLEEVYAVNADGAGLARVTTGGGAPGRGRPGHPRFHRLPSRELAADLVQQPAGAAEQRDQAPHRRGGRLPQRGGGQAAHWGRAGRAAR